MRSTAIKTLALVVGNLLPCVAIIVLVFSVSARAQTERHAVVTTYAPIFPLPDAGREPLRVAAAGSILNFLKEENGWTQVEFQDPQFGLRTGWIQTRFVRVEAANAGSVGANPSGATAVPRPR